MIAPLSLSNVLTVLVALLCLWTMLGYLKTALDAKDKAELLELIDEHRQERVPLIVPLTLMRHHVRRHRVAYLEGQIYLEPHPRELSLRNHV